jgi:hypothetical protein
MVGDLGAARASLVGESERKIRPMMQIIEASYFHVSWPLTTEIATQYLFLVLTDVRAHYSGYGCRSEPRTISRPSVTALLAEVARLEQVRHAGGKPTVMHLALTHEELNDMAGTAQAPSRHRAAEETTLFPLD